MKITTNLLRRGVLFAFGCFAVIQLIPYGHNHANPPIVKEPAWNSPATRMLAKRACFNCHSYETTWPWYSRLAPASWLIYHDVQQGRRKVNFSNWQEVTGAQFKREISSGEMPPIQYRLAHPEARLTAAEKQSLIDGLTATSVASR